VKNIEQINTPGAEFSPAFYKDGTAFCSSRDGSKKAFISFDGGNEVVMLDLYYEPLLPFGLRLKPISFMSPPSSEAPIRRTKGFIPTITATPNSNKPLNKPQETIPPPENLRELNSSLHEGPASFTRDSKEIYFTRTIKGKREKKQKAVISALQILHSKKDSTGKWSKPISALDINSSHYSVAHPCLTKSGNRLYFMSDMPGGYGGTDIYYVEKDESGAWEKPVNLGPEVNTF
ncbi:MAG: flagellar motor protein MotB, partial [Bacteroidota bacterium]